MSKETQDSLRLRDSPVRLDTGCGIPADVLPRIFEPFFSAKDVGKGAGLGLATAHGIVQQHEGWIEVESFEGVERICKVLSNPRAMRLFP